jgi:hypothetical protein
MCFLSFRPNIPWFASFSLIAAHSIARTTETLDLETLSQQMHQFIVFYKFSRFEVLSLTNHDLFLLRTPLVFTRREEEII